MNASPLLAIDAIPAVVDDDWLRTHVLLLSRSTYFRHKARGVYVFLEVDPPVLGCTRYSGVKIARWLKGDLRATTSYPRIATRGPKRRSA